MKSEKARQELDDGSWKVEVDFEGEAFDLPYYAVRVDVAQYAVEIAEQEAEERMREEMTRWHDPKEELPQRNIDVLVKLRDTYKGDKIHFSVGYINGACWFGDSIGATDDVIGWREIHE